jgi:hypothetical protein
MHTLFRLCFLFTGIYGLHYVRGTFEPRRDISKAKFLLLIGKIIQSIDVDEYHYFRWVIIVEVPKNIFIYFI